MSARDWPDQMSVKWLQVIELGMRMTVERSDRPTAAVDLERFLDDASRFGHFQLTKALFRHANRSNPATRTRPLPFRHGGLAHKANCILSIVLSVFIIRTGLSHAADTSANSVTTLEQSTPEDYPSIGLYGAVSTTCRAVLAAEIMALYLRLEPPSRSLLQRPAERGDTAKALHRKTMRILELNLGSASLEAVNAALAGQGYEIVRGAGLTAEGILALSPEVLITEATPSDLSCCAVITQLKSGLRTAPSLKVVMIAHGGALERARALDLGTDDVISFPFDPVEFAARIRTQIREPRPEPRTLLDSTVHNPRHINGSIVLMRGEAASKRHYSLIAAICALGVVAVLLGFIGISSRDNRQDTLQLRAEIARLNSNLQPEGNLLLRTEQARGSANAKPDFASAARNSLKAQSESLRKRAATAEGAEADSLKQQLLETQKRLALLEREAKIAEDVVHKYGPSVCLLHVEVGFLDRQSREPIQVAVDPSGKPRTNDKGIVQFKVGGRGPRLQIDAFGTGFLAAADGTVLTNHHVVEPWWQNDELKQVLPLGVDPYVLSYEAYFPGRSVSFPARLDRISSEADVATLKLEAAPPANAEALELDGRGEASVTGEPVVLIGYPTGVEGILARADPAVAQRIAGGTQDVSVILSRLASQNLIRPLTTQGHIGDILRDKIVYDAATTSGGSGGPLFNRNGKVIGINFAIIRGFGGSNLAIPVRYAADLLK